MSHSAVVRAHSPCLGWEPRRLNCTLTVRHSGLVLQSFRSLPTRHHNHPRRGQPVNASPEAGTPPVSSEDYVQLGRSSLNVSSIGVGAISWGDPNKGWQDRFQESDLQDICAAATRAGINFYDTAEIYGYQNTDAESSSESLVRRAAMPQRPEARPVVIGSKFFTIPWTNFLLGGGLRFGMQSMSDALDATLKRLGTDAVDLYQIHFPFPTYSQETLADGLQDAVESGRAKAVGVCNYSKEQLEKIHALLDKRGISLASNQIEYNLLKRDCEKNGVLEACKQLGITPVAHSPLSQGLLTDSAMEREDAQTQKVKQILRLLQLVGAVNGGKSIEATALNYLLCRGAVAIPGAKSVSQVESNAGAMGWRLDDNEVEIFNEKLTSMGM